MAVEFNPFKKATRTKTRLRMALCGPAGSGKSYTALRIANALKHLIESDLGRPARIAAIDTERGTLVKYLEEIEDNLPPFDWDNLDLVDYSPSSYTAMIKAAERQNYDICIVDSLSHAWSGSGGALEIVDRKTAAGRSGNAFTDGWREVTPMHNAMLDAILGSTMHVICTMRSKMEYVMEQNDKGKMVPRKIGMGPVQRAGMEYEFDIVGDIDQASHACTVSKTRCKAITDAIITKPGLDLARPIWVWLNKGTEASANSGGSVDAVAAAEIAKAVGVRTEADAAKEAEAKAAAAKAAAEARQKELRELADNAAKQAAEKVANAATTQEKVAAVVGAAESATENTPSSPAGNQQPATQPPTNKCTQTQIARMLELKKLLKVADSVWNMAIAKRLNGETDATKLTVELANDVIAKLEEKAREGGLLQSQAS